MIFFTESDQIVSKPRSQSLVYPAILIVIVAGIAMRLYFAVQMQAPGHGDLSYYFALAKNLAAGRGFVIDYVWHFLVLPDGLTHYSNDFWMPLTSIIISIFLIAFGESMPSALLPSIIFGLGLAFITFFIGMEYTKSRIISLWSAIICLFAPSLFKYSLLTDSSIYYAVFVAAGLLMIVKAKSQPKFYIAAAIFAGLAHLTRQDGLFLMLVLLLAIVVSAGNTKSKLRLVIFGLAAYLLTLSPLLIINFIVTGKLFLSRTYQIAFVTTHDDIYSYAKDLSLSSYLSWGMRNILASKIAALWNNIIAILQSFSRELVVIPILAFIRIISLKIWRWRWNDYYPPLIFLALLFVFYTLIATFPAMGGAFFRSAMAFVPFGIVLAVEMLKKIIRKPAAFGLLMTLIVVAAIAGSVRLSKATVVDVNQQEQELKSIAATIETKNIDGAEIVIMTRNPWETNVVTGFKAVQIPNNDIDAIYEIARKYGANYLILPAPRPALEGIYSGEIRDPRFEFVANVEKTDYKIFRISGGP